MATSDQSAPTPISRRRLLQGSALLGVAAFLAACGTKGTAPSAAPTEAPTSGASAAPGASASSGPSATPEASMIADGKPADVAWANWPLYIDVDAKGGHPTIQAFEKKYGVKVTYKEVINDNVDFFGKIKPNLDAGQPTGWDLIIITDWMVIRLLRLNWLERFNPAHVPNFVANVRDQYKGVPWDPNLEFHAPWQSGMTGMGYDPKVTGEITSLKSLFTADPRWTGKVDFLSEMVDCVGLTMLYLGLDPTQPTRDSADKAMAAIKQARDAGIIRAFRGNDFAQDLSAGDAVLVQAWLGDMVQVLVDKPGLKFAMPEEGAMYWTDNMLIPKGAAQPYTAELLIDWYYLPENAALVTDYVNYISPVKGADLALKKIDPEVVNNPLIFPPEEWLNRSKIFGPMTADDEAYFLDQFAKVSGVG